MKTIVVLLFLFTLALSEEVDEVPEIDQKDSSITEIPEEEIAETVETPSDDNKIKESVKKYIESLKEKFANAKMDDADKEDDNSSDSDSDSEADDKNTIPEEDDQITTPTLSKQEKIKVQLFAHLKKQFNTFMNDLKDAKKEGNKKEMIKTLVKLHRFKNFVKKYIVKKEIPETQNWLRKYYINKILKVDKSKFEKKLKQYIIIWKLKQLHKLANYHKKMQFFGGMSLKRRSNKLNKLWKIILWRMYIKNKISNFKKPALLGMGGGSMDVFKNHYKVKLMSNRYKRFVQFMKFRNFVKALQKKDISEDDEEVVSHIQPNPIKKLFLKNYFKSKINKAIKKMIIQNLLRDIFKYLHYKQSKRLTNKQKAINYIKKMWAKRIYQKALFN